MTDDRDLRAWFASLRQQINDRAPSFDAVRGRTAVSRRERPGAWTVTAAATFATAGIALLLWFSHSSSLQPDIPDAPMLGWTSPTDFLLHPPDQTMLYGVPKLGDFPNLILPPEGGPQPITLQRSSLPEIFS